MRLSGRWGAARAVALVAVLALGTGCSGLRLHRPDQLARAEAAREHFREAALADAVAAERERQARVLEDELELVREHTLARRDARLLYLIGEGGAASAWEWLGDEIEARLAELGLSAEELDRHLVSQAAAAVFLDELESQEADWEVRRAATPGLPVLGCPLGEIDRNALTDAAKVDLELYAETCADYLAEREAGLESRPVDRRLSDAVRTARAAAREEARAALAAYRAAAAAHAEAVARGAEPSAAAADLLAAAAALDAFAGHVAGLAEVGKAAGELAPLGLESAVADLTAVADAARAEAARDAVLGALSTALASDAAKRRLAPALAGRAERSVPVARSLAALGRAVAMPEEAPVESLVLALEQLELDRRAAARRLAVFDRTLELLAAKEAAYRVELGHLGEAERLRREIRGELGGEPPCPTIGAEDFFATPPTVGERCRDRVFRLLVAYSNAWTLGRVEQERIDYRLIALQHAAALDASEIALARWQSLLGGSLDQLVAYQETGLRPETLSAIVQALGLGSIAARID